jgi:hypothetical protein
MRLEILNKIVKLYIVTKNSYDIVFRKQKFLAVRQGIKFNPNMKIYKTSF